MARGPFDIANDILADTAVGRGNAILGQRVPSLAAGNAILAGAGLRPSAGGYAPLSPRTPLAPTRTGTAGGVWSGPHYTTPKQLSPRSPLANLIGDDHRRGAAEGYAVNINTWAGLLEGAGVPGSTILTAYQAAGGSNVLSAQQKAGDTLGFLMDFVQALEEQDIDPGVIVATYQDAGGRIGQPGGGGGGGGRGGFLGDVARETNRAAEGAKDVMQDAVDRAKKFLNQF